MRTRQKFIKLTKLTYPHGTENQLKNFLPKGYKKDEYGNFYLKIGETPSSMFACHLDTACEEQKKVTHSFSGNYIGTDGSTILGADDKAGMVVLLSLIEKQIPGLYYFFIGEEVGCVGSGRLSLNWTTEYADYITKVISFDRRGTTSVITDQFYGKCASDEFAEELSLRLNSVGDFNFSPDNTGMLTDSINFMDMVPECTNISVGYYDEHTNTETQDLDFLNRLCDAVCKIDWETLPIERDPGYGWYDEEEYNFGGHPGEDDDPEWSDEYWSHFRIDGKTKKMYISKKRIRIEISAIYDCLFMIGGYSGFTGINWNGNILKVEFDDKIETVGGRMDLIGMVPELKSVSIRDLSETPYTYRKLLK